MFGVDNNFAKVVIDNGSGFCKVGFANKLAPEFVFPSMVSWSTDTAATNSQQICVGSSAGNNQQYNVMHQHPIEEGIIVNWDHMDKIWRFAFKQLNVDPSKCHVVLTESIHNTNANRSKMVRTMFQNIGIQSLLIVTDAKASLYASKRNTGLVIDCGFDSTRVVAIHNDIMDSRAANFRLALGGRDLTNYLIDILPENRQASFFPKRDRKDVQKIKETLCYVSLDYEQDKDTALSSMPTANSYTLENGNVINVGTERVKCTEPLFRPSLLNCHAVAIHRMALYAISQFDKATQKTLFENIILSGSSTMFPNFGDRLKNEIISLTSSTMNINVIELPDRNILTWKGAAMLTNSTTLDNSRITKDNFTAFISSLS